MKQTVFVIVLLVLSIGIPILAESNDSLSTESENPVLQNQELKLPWYKNMNYTLAYNNDSSLLTSGSSSKDTLKGKGIPFWMKLDYGIGYSGGLCWTGEDLARSFEASPIAGPFILPMYFVAHLYYLNSIEVSATYPLKKGKGIEVGMGYGWTKLNEGGISTDIYDFFGDTDIHLRWGVSKVEKFTLYLANSPIDHGISKGIELIFSKGYGIERYYENWDLKDSLNVVRNGIGGGIFIKWCPKRVKISRNIRIIPFLLFRLAFANEFNNDSPRKDMWKDKLELNYSVLYGGIKLNFGGLK